MRHRSFLVVALVLVGLVPWMDRVDAASTERLGGNDRYETAVAVAQKVKAEGRAGSTVLLTTGENFPD
ncbi:MAG: cell wall-binding repeat-containing protein, partial [Actinomycetota bacterium]